MPRTPKKEIGDTPEKIEEAVEAPEVKKTPKSKAGEVSVYSPNGELIRTYSEDKHGEDYKELAKGFAEKVAGRTLK